MLKKFLSASVATALVLGSVTPAYAQYAFSPEPAPLGATATLNFKVPLGVAPTKNRKASYGLTVGYGQRLNGVTADGRIATRQAKLADLRFTDSFKLWKAEVASFDLANLDKDRRLNMGPDDGEGKGNTTWIVIGLVAAGVAVCLLADCFGGDDDDDDDDDDVL
jgi:hypothetical protein